LKGNRGKNRNKTTNTHREGGKERETITENTVNRHQRRSRCGHARQPSQKPTGSPSKKQTRRGDGEPTKKGRSPREKKALGVKQKKEKKNQRKQHSDLHRIPACKRKKGTFKAQSAKKGKPKKTSQRKKKKQYPKGEGRTGSRPEKRLSRAPNRAGKPRAGGTRRGPGSEGGGRRTAAIRQKKRAKGYLRPRTEGRTTFKTRFKVATGREKKDGGK